MLTQEQLIQQLHTRFDSKLVIPKASSIQSVFDMMQTFDINSFISNYTKVIEFKSDVNEIKQLTLKYVEETLPQKFLAKTPKDFQNNSHPHVQIVDELRNRIMYSGSRDQRAITYNAALVSKPPADRKELIMNTVFDNLIKSFANHVEQGLYKKFNVESRSNVIKMIIAFLKNKAAILQECYIMFVWHPLFSFFAFYITFIITRLNCYVSCSDIDRFFDPWPPLYSEKSLLLKMDFTKSFLKRKSVKYL